MKFNPLQQLTLCELLPRRLSEDERRRRVAQFEDCCNVWLRSTATDPASKVSRSDARKWAGEVGKHAHALLELLGRGGPYRQALQSSEALWMMAYMAVRHALPATAIGSDDNLIVDTAAAITPARDLLSASRQALSHLAQAANTMETELSKPGPDNETAVDFVRFVSDAWVLGGLGRPTKDGSFGRFVIELARCCGVTVSKRTVQAGLAPSVATPDGRRAAMVAAASKHGPRIRKRLRVR